MAVKSGLSMQGDARAAMANIKGKYPEVKHWRHITGVSAMPGAIQIANPGSTPAYEYRTFLIGTLEGEAAEIANRALARSITPIPYKPPSPEFMKLLDDMQRLTEDLRMTGSAWWTVGADGLRRRVDPSTIVAHEADKPDGALIETCRRVVADAAYFNSFPGYLVSRTPEADKPGVTEMAMKINDARDLLAPIDYGSVKLPDGSPRFVKQRDGRWFDLLGCDDGIALTSASHPGNSGAIPVADHLTDDHAFSPGSVEHGEMDSETGKVTWGTVEVTPEMIAAAKEACEIEPGYASDSDFADIYRAMHAVALVPLVSEVEDRIAALTRERDAAQRNFDTVCSLNDDFRSKFATLSKVRFIRFPWPPPADVSCEYVAIPKADYEHALHARLTAEQPTDLDYNGPVKDGKAVPDPVHEQFHRAVGDVIAGKVIPAARRQMEEALKSVPKEKAPFPSGVGFGDPRRIGG